MYAFGVCSTLTSFFLCLFALMCVKSVDRISPPTSPFSMYCRRISSKIFSAMSLSRNLRRRFWLIAVASGTLSVQSSPQNHLYAMLELISSSNRLLDLISYRSPASSIRNSTSGSIASPVVRTIQRRTQIVDEAEVHRPIHVPQQVILRNHLLHDNQIHLLQLLSPL